MITSREYALQRLDKWYKDKIERYYTSELADELSRRVTKRLLGEGDLGAALLFALITPSAFSREAQLNQAHNYFTQGYATLEASVEGYEVEGCTIDEIPDGIRAEYVEPMERVARQMQAFVDRVRQKAVEIDSRELTDEELNSAAIEVFGNRTEFARMYASMGEAVLQLMNVMGGGQSIPKTIKTNMIKIWDAWKAEIPYMVEQIFPEVQ